MSAPDPATQSPPIRLIAYSDYLCPWCFNASVRLHRLEVEEPDVEIEWRSYLLRPEPRGGRDPEKFRAYTRSWQRPASEEDSGSFRIWASDAPPPSHSVPAHQVAKAARLVGEEAFRRMHQRLLVAYFEQNQDISDARTLRALWDELQLAGDAFDRHADDDIVAAVHAEHQEAIGCGATGVPAVRLADYDVAVTGALPYEAYRRWVAKERGRRASRNA
ncbi:MAG: DsbA family protein [Myxococcota bacterium]